MVSKFCAFAFSFFLPFLSYGAETLRIFTWDGYVSPEDLAAVNKILEKENNPVRVEVIKTLAEGPEQMYSVMRSKECDLSFLTLNYIKADREKSAQLLQGIDTSKLKNYSQVLPALKKIPMGVKDDKVLYVPYGGGAYGIWANMKKLSKADLPVSLNDLLDPKWKGKISLTSGQIQPNVALAMLAVGKPPFYINDLIVENKIEEAKNIAGTNGAYQKYLNALYAQVGFFWSAAPEFKDNLTLVASYGPEIAALIAKGEKWQLVNFKEGNTVWLDTMNIMNHVKDKKLEAAYVFIDYFLSPNVQNRVVDGLSMVAVTNNVKNPLLENNPNFFDQRLFWPPYSLIGNNIMKAMSDAAMKK